MSSKVDRFLYESNANFPSIQDGKSVTALQEALVTSSVTTAEKGFLDLDVKSSLLYMELKPIVSTNSLAHIKGNNTSMAMQDFHQLSSVVYV